ncbi:RING finger and CHY zinc finger domain-containing protein 1-like [Photinus pyralis]|nr:RING finger and CHY zinc finger domain-containing protein 1-like [Photinus pyralis]
MAEAATSQFWQSGCEHYKRHCRIMAPCCNNVYPCHVCHDESEDHALIRTSISKLLCIACNTLQDAKKQCDSCRASFGKYACLLCFIFDDYWKGQFHCDKCGLCRVGGQNNYFHCTECNMCLARTLMDNHKCVTDCAAGNCPVCAENLHTTRKTLHVLPCGHILHSQCYEAVKNEQESCTVCEV